MPSAPRDATLLERENENLRAQLASLQDSLVEAKAHIETLRQSEALYRRLHQARIDAFARTTLDGRIEEANELFCRMVGYSEQELRSMTWRDLTPARWHAAEEDILRREVVARSVSERYEKEYCHKDGTVVPVELRTFLVPAADGITAVGFAAVVRDITARKRGQEARRESEEKFRTAFLTSLDACYIGTLADGAIIEINPAFERMFGYSRDEAIDHTSQQLGLWVDYEDRLRMRDQLLANGFVKEMETLGRRKNGEVFPCSLSTTALWMQGHHCVIGIARDISGRKAAEDALEEAQRRLRDLSVRLMNVQEVERARLARELHDDFSQRLALLAVKLHLLRQAMPEDAAAPRESVNDLYREVQALARDVRRTSHELHPTRLEQLGLTSAMRGLCDDVAAAHGLAIRFDARNVSRDLPEPLALCFYRVAQEALQNVIRHSGAREAVVDLEASERELRLVVTDPGCGFDTASRRSASLGLASIEERVRAIDGRFEIQSEVGRGTRIEVRAPLVTGSSST